MYVAPFPACIMSSCTYQRLVSSRLWQILETSMITTQRTFLVVWVRWVLKLRYVTNKFVLASRLQSIYCEAASSQLVSSSADSNRSTSTSWALRQGRTRMPTGSIRPWGSLDGFHCFLPPSNQAPSQGMCDTRPVYKDCMAIKITAAKT